MHGRRTVLIAALVLAGCSKSDGPPPAAACTAGAADVTAALRAAPGDVRLDGGTPISECVERARSDAELQNLGLILTEVAEELEARAARNPSAALQLGYLIGAARRGAPSESALQAELVHRLERSAAVDLPAGGRRSLAEGMRAGEANG